MAKRLSIFFQSREGYGWTENYNFSGVQTGNALVTYMTNVAHIRALFLTSDCKLVRIRLASDFKRDPLIFDFLSDTACAGQYGFDMNNNDNALIARLERTGVGYNRVLMRGIPDRLVSENVFTPDAAWLGSWNTWVAEIRDTGNWSVVATVDNAQAPLTPQSLVPNIPKGIVVTMFPPDTLPTGGKVYVSGASIFGYNGIKNVVKGPTTQGPNTYLLGGAQPPANLPAGNHPIITPKVAISGTVQQFFYERFTTRAPGRFFGQRRGRARTVLSLRP